MFVCTENAHSTCLKSDFSLKPNEGKLFIDIQVVSIIIYFPYTCKIYGRVALRIGYRMMPNNHFPRSNDSVIHVRIIDFDYFDVVSAACFPIHV